MNIIILPLGLIGFLSSKVYRHKPEEGKTVTSASITVIALGTLLIFIFGIFFVAEKGIVTDKIYNYTIPVILVIFIIGMILSIALVESKK